MTEKALQKTLDRQLETAEAQIDRQYSDALERFMRDNKDTLRRIKALMDGEEKPPRWMVSEKQQEAWRYKQLTKLLEGSHLLEKAAGQLRAAGQASVKRIKRYATDTFNTAYKGVDEQLRE